MSIEDVSRVPQQKEPASSKKRISFEDATLPPTLEPTTQTRPPIARLALADVPANSDANVTALALAAVDAKSALGAETKEKKLAELASKLEQLATIAGVVTDAEDVRDVRTAFSQLESETKSEKLLQGHLEKRLWKEGIPRFKLIEERKIDPVVGRITQAADEIRAKLAEHSKMKMLNKLATELEKLAKIAPRDESETLRLLDAFSKLEEEATHITLLSGHLEPGLWEAGIPNYDQIRDRNVNPVVKRITEAAQTIRSRVQQEVVTKPSVSEPREIKPYYKKQTPPPLRKPAEKPSELSAVDVSKGDFASVKAALLKCDTKRAYLYRMRELVGKLEEYSQRKDLTASDLVQLGNFFKELKSKITPEELRSDLEVPDAISFLRNARNPPSRQEELRNKIIDSYNRTYQTVVTKLTEKLQQAEDKREVLAAIGKLDLETLAYHSVKNARFALLDALNLKPAERYELLLTLIDAKDTGTVDRLLNRGYDSYVNGIEGSTELPIHLAMDSDSLLMVNLFLQKKVDVFLTRGATPSALARAYAIEEKTELVTYIHERAKEQIGEEIKNLTKSDVALSSLFQHLQMLQFTDEDSSWIDEQIEKLETKCAEVGLELSADQKEILVNL